MTPVQATSELASTRLTPSGDPRFIVPVMLGRRLALHEFVLYVAESRQRLRRRLGEELRRNRTLSLQGPSGTSLETPAAEGRLDLVGIYGSQKNFVWLTLQRMGIPRSDLDDVFQDVFMIAHRRLHTYKPDAKLSAWLYGICLRSVAAHRRRAFRRRERADGADAGVARPGTEHWHAEVEAPDERLRKLEQRATLNDLLDTLDPEHRMVVVMFEVEDQSCQCIAELIGVPVGTVHSRLHTARRKLAKAAVRLRHQGGAP
jgi:RNA polymerase sigma-70 factor (ECF subfamily)